MPSKLPDIPLKLSDVALYTEALLRRASISPGIGAYKPHPKQISFHSSSEKEKLFIGGNRSGKTVGAVTEDIMWLTGKHKFRDDIPGPPIRGRIVAVDIEDGVKKIILPELAKWTPPSFLINDSWEDSYDKQSRTLTLNNGSFVELMSYEQDVEKFAGTSRHFVHFDEEPPKDIYDECLMRLVDTDGSYWITMTPLIEMSWVKTQVYEPWEAGDKSIFVVQVDTEDNPHVAASALSRLTRGLSEEERAARTKGVFITHTGLVYQGSFSALSYTDGGNVIHDIVGSYHFKDFVRGWGHFTCMDHGFANPTVFLFCCFDETGNIIVYDELYQTRTTVRDLAGMYLRRLESLEVAPIYCVGDPSNLTRSEAITGTTIQSEYMEHGVAIALGHKDVNAGIVRCQNRFQQKKLYISERCKETLKEIGNYRWDRFASSRIESRRNKKEVPLKKNDHCMDAMRYGVMSRPALETDAPEGVGNIFNAAVAGVKDIDYEATFSESPAYDEHLGIEW